MYCLVDFGLYSKFSSSLYIINIISWLIYNCNDFSHSVNSLFILLIYLFYCGEAFDFYGIPLLIIGIISCDDTVLFRKPLLICTARIFTFIFSSGFKVANLTLISLNDLGSIFFCRMESYGSSFFHLPVDIQFSSHHLWKKLSFLQCVILAFLFKKCSVYWKSFVLVHW